jgi:hypothetical protein
MSGWIKCSTRLPEDQSTVLCWDGEEYRIGQKTNYHYPGLHWFRESGEPYAFSAEYWMPIPPPPTEGEARP